MSSGRWGTSISGVRPRAAAQQLEVGLVAFGQAVGRLVAVGDLRGQLSPQRSTERGLVVARPACCTRFAITPANGSPASFSRRWK